MIVVVISRACAGALGAQKRRHASGAPRCAIHDFEVKVRAEAFLADISVAPLVARLLTAAVTSPALAVAAPPQRRGVADARCAASTRRETSDFSHPGPPSRLNFRSPQTDPATALPGACQQTRRGPFDKLRVTEKTRDPGDSVHRPFVPSLSKDVRRPCRQSPTGDNNRPTPTPARAPPTGSKSVSAVLCSMKIR